MATYKVPQNVEAEDHLIGNLTFKQFIYLIVATMGVFIGWALFGINPFLAVIPLPVVIIFGILGAYSREDQPIEMYALAFLNFLIKPRQRIWKNGVAVQNVKIKAPKKTAQTRRARSPEEARSQLKQLAQVVDTRGWSLKRPELTEPAEHHQIDNTDRIVAPQTSYSQEPLEVRMSDDIFEGQSQTAETIASQTEQTTAEARQAAINRMKQAMNQPPRAEPEAQAKPQASAPATQAASQRDPKTMPQSGQQVAQAESDQPLPENIHYNPYPAMHQKTVAPAGEKTKKTLSHDQPANQAAKQAEQSATAADQQPPASSGNPPDENPQQKPDPDDIVRLAQSDIKVSEIAKQANRKPEGEIDEGEEISLR